MGGTLTKAFYRHILGKKETKLVMLGLDAAGKTTVMYKLKLGEIVMSIPTIG
jgi:ADP-ribosylation factor protein 1